MKNNISVLPIHTDQVMFIREQQIRLEFEEIVEQVNSKNVAVIFWRMDQLVVLAPYWRYIPVLGPDPVEAISFMFEASKSENEAMAMKFTGIALGFIRMTTRESAQNILNQYLPLVNSHPYANYWRRVLDNLAVYWNTDHSPELVMAGYFAERKICLLFTDGSNRLVDMNNFLGKGLTEEELREEANFRGHLTLSAGTLIWEGDSKKVRVTFSSGELLKQSYLLEVENPKYFWSLADKRQIFAGIDRFCIYDKDTK